MNARADATPGRTRRQDGREPASADADADAEAGGREREREGGRQREDGREPARASAVAGAGEAHATGMPHFLGPIGLRWDYTKD